MTMERRDIVKFSLFAVLTLLFLFFAIPRWRVSLYLGKLQKQGERLAVSDWLPTYPPSKHDSVQILREALSLFPKTQDVLETNPPSAMTRKANGKIILSSSQPDVRSEGSTNTWEQVEAALKKIDGGLLKLETLVGEGPFDFHLPYGTPFMNKPDLHKLRTASYAVEAAAIFDLHQRNYDHAVRHILTLFALSQGLRLEPTVLSQKVRLRIAARGIATTWELLQYPEATEGQLAQIATDLNSLDFLQLAERTCCMERAICESTISQVRSSSLEKYMFGSSSTPVGWPDKALIITWQHWSGYLDEHLALEGYQEVIKNARTLTINHVFSPVMTAQLREFSKPGMRLMLPTGGFRMDANFFNPFSEEVGDTYTYLLRLERVETLRQLALTAVALRRYQIQHGNYPTSLGDLVPELLSRIPLDPEDGKPLRYSVTGKTFLLYSVGPNGLEEGGNTHFQGEEPFRSTRDEVWPQLEIAEKR